MKDQITTPQPLLDDPAGTTFTLEIGVTCTVTATGQADSHIDRWF